MKAEDPSTDPSVSNVVTKAKTINAIEAKLKAMEREKEAGEPAGSSANFFYQYNKEPQAPTIRPRPKHYDRPRSSQNHRKRPYRR